MIQIELPDGIKACAVITIRVRVRISGGRDNRLSDRNHQ